jgi:hypothetical protein
MTEGARGREGPERRRVFTGSRSRSRTMSTSPTMTGEPRSAAADWMAWIFALPVFVPMAVITMTTHIGSPVPS